MKTNKKCKVVFIRDYESRPDTPRSRKITGWSAIRVDPKHNTFYAVSFRKPKLTAKDKAEARRKLCQSLNDR